MNEHLQDYLLKSIGKNPEWAIQLEQYAHEHQVPIMEPTGIDFLMQLVRIKKPKKILEVGTAIGYSALRMLEAYKDTHIVTIERDEGRYQEAIHNIRRLDKQDNIDVIFGDALEVTCTVKAKGPYDFLFIDAAKGQYQRFFEMYSEFLTDDAIIITDNVLFKGFVVDNNTESKRLKKVATKVNQYNEWLVDHPTYKTTIVPIGDGVAISVKR